MKQQTRHAPSSSPVASAAGSVSLVGTSWLTHAEFVKMSCSEVGVFVNPLLWCQLPADYAVSLLTVHCCFSLSERPHYLKSDPALTVYVITALSTPLFTTRSIAVVIQAALVLRHTRPSWWSAECMISCFVCCRLAAFELPGT